MSEEYVWNELRVRRNENGKWEYRIRLGHVWIHCDDNTPGAALFTGLKNAVTESLNAQIEQLKQMRRTIVTEMTDDY